MAVSGFTLQGGGNSASSFLGPKATNQDQKTKNNGAAVPLVQGTSTGISLAGGAGGSNGALNQSAAGKAPVTMQNTAARTTDASVAIDPAAAAAAAKDAADKATAGRLRGEVTNIVNSIKDLLNARYGQLDSAAQEQVGKLNTRFQNESADLTGQIGAETESAGAAASAGGVFDSSYRGNNQDTITNAGQAQIRGLGDELSDNTAAIGSTVQKEKASLDAQKGGYEATVARLAEETDPGRLTDLRNTIDAKLRETQAGNADNATQKSAVVALNAIAPTNARAQSLQTTLSKIVGGNAPTAQKSAIATSLIKASGVSSDEAQRLAAAFQSDLSNTDKQLVQQ